MIEFDLIQAIIDASGIREENIQSIDIDPQGAVFTCLVRVPTEDGSLGPIMLHDGEIMIYRKVVPIHRAHDHVHGGDDDVDHEHPGDLTP